MHRREGRGLRGRISCTHNLKFEKNIFNKNVTSRKPRHNFKMYLTLDFQLLCFSWFNLWWRIVIIKLLIWTRLLAMTPTVISSAFRTCRRAWSPNCPKPNLWTDCPKSSSPSSRPFSSSNNFGKSETSSVSWRLMRMAKLKATFLRCASNFDWKFFDKLIKFSIPTVKCYNINSISLIVIFNLF